MSRRLRPEERDRWVVLTERVAPWIVAGLVVGIVVLWLLTAVLGHFRPGD